MLTQHKDAGPRKERGNHLKARVLRRSANEGNLPAFDKRQQKILLRLVEAVYLVDEENLGLPKLKCSPFARHIFYVLFARVDSRKFVKFGIQRVGIYSCMRRFAAPRRPPQFEGKEVLAFYCL